jgi:DNA polymerase elongation subunit (family B)
MITRQQFESFKACIANGDFQVTNIIENSEGYEVRLSDGSIVDLPMNCKAWVDGVNRTLIDDIIYGKNKLNNIVNISYKEDNVHIFQEFKNEIKETIIPFKHYVLSPFKGQDTQKLIGDTNFRYIKEYPSEYDFHPVKPNVYKFKLFYIAHQAEAFMCKEGYTYFKGMKPIDPSVLSFDIETSGLNPKAKNAEVFIITNTFRKDNITIQKSFTKDQYKNDTQMIEAWADWVREVNPSVVIGHNIIMFDIPYLESRVKHGLKLGRDDSILTTEQRPREFRKDGSQSYSYNRKFIFGREIIDTFFVAIKYDIGRKYESYGLKSLIREEGLEKTDRTFIDASKISEYWKDETMKSLVIKYATEDSDDALKLYDLMISATFYFSQMIPKPFQLMTESATGSQLNSLMIRSYLQKGFSIPKADDAEGFEGAISNGFSGIYKNAIRFDVASLYPSIMVQYQIENTDKDFNGNFQKIVKYLRTERLTNKKLAKETGDRYYDDIQNTQKTAINSLYGFLGASGLNFNYPEGAASVTRYGREILKKAIKFLTNKEYEQHVEEKANHVV